MRLLANREIIYFSGNIYFSLSGNTLNPTLEKRLVWLNETTTFESILASSSKIYLKSIIQHQLNKNIV